MDDALRPGVKVRRPGRERFVGGRVGQRHGCQRAQVPEQAREAEGPHPHAALAEELPSAVGQVCGAELMVVPGHPWTRVTPPGKFSISPRTRTPCIRISRAVSKKPVHPCPTAAKLHDHCHGPTHVPCRHGLSEPRPVPHRSRRRTGRAWCSQRARRRRRLLHRRFRTGACLRREPGGLRTGSGLLDHPATAPAPRDGLSRVRGRRRAVSARGCGGRRALAARATRAEVPPAAAAAGT